MLFELVTTESDESPLHGILHRVENQRGMVIHVHGTWGNFYENSFVQPLAKLYSDAGYSFASLNFPGHDGTAVFEKIDAFSPALSAWMSTLGATSGDLILQGHSLGAIKISHLLSSEGLPGNVTGIVLLAPFDAVAFNSRSRGGDVEALHKELSSLAAQGETMVPSRIFEYWPISIETLTDLTTPGSEWDQFPTRNQSIGRFSGQSVVPTFAAVGSDDFAATPSPAEVISLFSVPKSITATLIDGAPHNFAGKESLLTSKLLVWLKVNGLAHS